MGNELEMLARALLPYMERTKAAQYGIAGSMFAYGEKHDSAGTPITTGYSHGPGGLLTFPGVDPDVFNAAMGPMSMLGQLPSMPSLETNPTYFTITGTGSDTGSEPAGVCDDAPVAGLMRGCLVTSVFGRYERATPELELNRLGQRNDRADPLDLRIVNSPIGGQIGGGGFPFLSGAQNPATPLDVLTNEVSRKFWERNVSLYRLLAKQLWIGTPVNNNAGGGYKEATGFQLLVNTGYKDAETGAACKNMDSWVGNFSYARIDLNGANIVAAVVNMVHQLRNRAIRTGLDPVRWVLAMRSQLFYELTAVWPCSYLTARCQLPAAGNTQFVDAQEVIRFRDEMRTGSYLLIDGIRFDVVLDDGIPEYNNGNQVGVTPGCYASDIYMIPMSVVGGRAVTYLEYFQYSNPSLQDALGNMVLGRIEGAFLTWVRQHNNCVQWQTKIEPRLVMRTPFLAGRLRNVAYCPVEHEQDVFPTDPYFVLDGKTSRPGPSYRDLWEA